jgi:hypothetical protein
MQQPTLDVSICPCCGSISLATIEMDAILIPDGATEATRPNAASPRETTPPMQAANSPENDGDAVLTDDSYGQLFFECSRCHWQGSTATVNVI